MKPFIYKAFITEVHDGDTINAEVDLGFGIQMVMKLRFSRINAWEVTKEEKDKGILARDWLREQILAKHVLIQTEKDKQEKYGRYLAEIEIDGRNINDEMVKLGHARYQSY